MSARKHIIGASNIAAVVGASPYLTPHELWEQLVRKEVVEENEHMKRGKFLEDGICNWWAWKSGATHVTKQLSLLHPDDPRIGATPDIHAMVGGAWVVADTKSPSNGKPFHEPSQTFPFHYRLQVQFQIGMARACGLSADYGELAAGPIWGRLLRFRVEFDAELFELMVSRAQDFLGYVERGEVLPDTWPQLQLEAA